MQSECCGAVMLVGSRDSPCLFTLWAAACSVCPILVEGLALFGGGRGRENGSLCFLEASVFFMLVGCRGS